MMVTMEEASNNRWLNALRLLVDVSRGTLWWVSDNLWASVIKGWVPRKVKPEKARHSGISLGRPPIESVSDVVPMLIGTTKRHGFSMIVHGLGTKRGEESATHYALRPYSLQVRECLGGDSAAIARNSHKPRLTADELKFLNKILAQKGIR